MKKYFMYIIIGMALLVFAACKGDDKETDFIPVIPSDTTEEEDNITENPNEDDQITDVTDETEEAEDTKDLADNVDETTTMYVKLATYGAILNVRSSPTTEADNIVGFLVHTEPVEVIAIDNGWASFMYKGEICYVSKDYLVDTVPPYISPPTPQS
ncbi:MAG: SH3 domain-containing protein [Clostridiales bacterium]|nr:SH3 domain-containing protein [Clostridiales bacterium]